jgi:heme-degrading monooxygenase HmoA
MKTDAGFASGLEPPYFAVIFSALRTEGDREYGATAERMAELARGMPGYLGIESARGDDGFGITVSYWRDEASILAWRNYGEHRLAQERGKREWYSHYELRVARVDRSYSGPAGRDL